METKVDKTYENAISQKSAEDPKASKAPSRIHEDQQLEERNIKFEEKQTEKQLEEKLDIQQFQEQRIEIQLKAKPKLQLKVQQNRHLDLDKQKKVQFEKMKTLSPNGKLGRKFMEQLDEQMQVLRRQERQLKCELELQLKKIKIEEHLKLQLKVLELIEQMKRKHEEQIEEQDKVQRLAEQHKEEFKKQVLVLLNDQLEKQKIDNKKKNSIRKWNIKAKSKNQ